MRKERQKKYKISTITVLLAVVVLISVIATLAYYHNEISVANKFKTMTYNVVIEEEFENKFGTKEVSFVNKEETNVDVVLRINYNEMWTLLDSEDDSLVYVLPNTINGKDVVTKGWTDDFKNNFVLGSDGWYYYKKVLGPTKSVKVLETIALNEELIKGTSDEDNYKKNYTYDLAFNYEAIQASSDAISENWGVTASIDGDEVTWTL